MANSRVPRCLDRNPLSVEVEFVGTSEVEEVRRKFEFTNDFELSKLLANAADAGAAGVCAQGADDGAG